MNKQQVLRELDALYELVNTQEHNAHEANGIYRALFTVEQMPDTETWIPVTERLPENGTTVWVTANYMGDLFVKESLYTERCFLDGRGISLNHVVTAWKFREVMIPYKEES